MKKAILICGVAGLFFLLGMTAGAGQADSAAFHLNTKIRKLNVVTNIGSPNPSGTHYYLSGSSVTASVTSPFFYGGHLWYCSGRAGAGSATSGVGPKVTFTILLDSTLTWNWTRTSNGVEIWQIYQ